MDHGAVPVIRSTKHRGGLKGTRKRYLLITFEVRTVSPTNLIFGVLIKKHSFHEAHIAIGPLGQMDRSNHRLLNMWTQKVEIWLVGSLVEVHDVQRPPASPYPADQRRLPRHGGHTFSLRGRHDFLVYLLLFTAPDINKDAKFTAECSKQTCM